MKGGMMSDKFEWSDEYLVGDKEIDDQHKTLFNLVNQLSDDASEEYIIEFIIYLSRYMREHFQAEEAYMRECGYPRLKEHIALHTDLSMRVSDLCLELGKNRTITSFQEFMAEWIIVHIQRHDKDFFEFIHKTRKNNDEGFSFNM